MSEEKKNIPEEPEFNNAKSPEESISALPPGSGEPNISTEELALPGSPLSKTEKQQIEITEPSTFNPKPPTSVMEVHHHGHVHEKKKWKEYVFQFLMLFLAITLGFFVENQREHYIERQRAKELAASMITDLKKDTALINWLQNFRIHQRKPRQDSFYLLLNTPSDKIDKTTYYKLVRSIAEFYTFTQSTGTINQMKNAGYLRYFSDPQLLNHISEYDFLVQDFKNDENLEFHLHYDKFMSLLKSTSDNDDMYLSYIKAQWPQGSGIKPFKQEVSDNIKALLIELMWYNHPQMIIQNDRVKNKAIEIINYLHTKYHVK